MGMKPTVCGQADLALLDIEMKVIFVRHGEPDYHELEERSYTALVWIWRLYLSREDGRLRNFASILYCVQLICWCLLQ